MPEMRSAAEEARHRELYRKSRDIIRVYNPLTIDFRYMYDRLWFTVKKQSTKDIERFHAEFYLKAVTDYIIGQMAITKGEAMIKDREKLGLQPFLNKYDENQAVWNNVQKTDDKSLRDEIGNQVIIGLVSEYGAEEAPEDQVLPVYSDVPDETKLLDKYTERRVSDMGEELPVIQPIVDMKRSKAKSVSAEEVTNEG